MPPRVLVIEDDVAITKVVRRVLERWGYAVIVAETGEAALEHVSRWVPDLVLVDLGLPDISGEQVIETMRATLGQRAPTAIALTGRGCTEVEGAAAVCRKPFGIEALVELVHAHTRRRPRSR